MNYIFPATKWANKETRPNDQYVKIIEEYNEFTESDPESDHEIEELFDLIQACETYFRIMEARGMDVNSIYEAVKEKNKARGYYDTANIPDNHPQ
jgi:predicted house-cleaning noncanonical NTP pyrophosphatase (MazG superfamily)